MENNESSFVGRLSGLYGELFEKSHAFRLGALTGLATGLLVGAGWLNLAIGIETMNVENIFTALKCYESSLVAGTFSVTALICSGIATLRNKNRE